MRTRWIVGSIVVGFLTVIVCQAHADVIKLGTTLPLEHPTCQSLEALQLRVGEQISIQIFPEAQLGSARDIWEGLQFGNIEIGILPADLLAAQSSSFAAILMPYIFRDDGHRFRVLDGPIGVRLLDSLRADNLIGLGFFDAGTKNFITKRQHIVNPEDLQGLKIAAILNGAEQPGQHNLPQLSAVQFFTQEGTLAALTPENVYTSLQADNIDGWEGNELDCLLVRTVETEAIYFTYSQHTAIPDVLVASKLWFDALAPEVQDALQAGAWRAVRQQRKLWADIVLDATTRLEGEGMRFKVIDRDAFYMAIQPYYEQIYAEHGADFEEIIRAIRAVK